MRLWSLDPAVLDRAALVACWREGLLAQKVLAGGTKGYTRHPQLQRFREQADPLAAIGHFLESLQQEATARGYRFDLTRVLRTGEPSPAIPVTDGQVRLERDHLRAKVTVRDPDWLSRVVDDPRASPTFVIVPGPVEDWERATSPLSNS